MPYSPDPTSLRAAFQRQRLFVAALVVLGVIMLIAVSGRVPLAGLLLGGLLLLLALVRLVMPTEQVGALAVRGRGLDAAFMALLGAGLLILSGSPNL